LLAALLFSCATYDKDMVRILTDIESDPMIVGTVPHVGISEDGALRVPPIVERIPIPDECPPQTSIGFPTFSRCMEQRDFNGDGLTDCLMSKLQDDEGNMFQLWCMRKSRISLPFFYWFGLFYIPDGGEPKFAGKCYFEGGKNSGFAFHIGDKDANGKPDRFIGSRWISVDGSIDDDFDGNMDVMIYNFDVNSCITKGTWYESSDDPSAAPYVIVQTFENVLGPHFNDHRPVVDVENIPESEPVPSSERLP